MPSKTKERKKNVPGYGFLRKDGRFQCERCGASYKNYKHLKRHVVHHTGIISFDCEICQRNFLRRDSLRRHMTACSRNNRLTHPKFTAPEPPGVSGGQPKELQTPHVFQLPQNGEDFAHSLPQASTTFPSGRLPEFPGSNKVFDGTPIAPVENIQYAGYHPGVQGIPWEHQHLMGHGGLYNANYHQMQPSYSSAIDLASLSTASYYETESAPSSSQAPIIAERPQEEQTFEWADQYELSRPSLLYES